MRDGDKKCGMGVRVRIPHLASRASYFYRVLTMTLTPSCRPRLPLNEALGLLFAGDGMKSSLASRRRASRSRKRYRTPTRPATPLSVELAPSEYLLCT